MKTFLFRATMLLLLTAATAQAQVPRRYPAAAAMPMAGSTPLPGRPADYPFAPAPRYAGSGHPGTYRLPDGSWHPAEIFGPDMPDRVRLHPDNLSDYAVFWPGEVSAYVVRGDTFVTVPAFVQRKGHRLVPASFAQRQYHDNRYELFLYQAPTPDTQRQYQQPAIANGPALPMPGAAVAVSPAAHRYSFFDFVMDVFVYPRTYQKVLLRQAGGQPLELPAKAGSYRRFMLSLLADDPALCAQLRAGQLATRQEAPQLLATYAAHRREALLQVRK